MPTAARQKYLAKQAAKKSDLLSDADRQAEYDKVMTQLSQISAPEVDKFEAMMSEWVKDGRVRQGVIPVPSIRRAIVYSLGISRSKTFVSLRSDNPDEYTTNNTESVKASVESSATLAADSKTKQVIKDEVDDEIPELVPSTTTTTAEPATVDPATVDPATADPATADPATADPATADPATADPATADPATLNVTSDKIYEPVTICTKPKKKGANNKKKQQTFAQPAPRGSRHASRPPAMKPKAQSA